MFRKYPLMSRLIVFVLLPLLAAAGAGWWRLRSSLPVEAGTLAAAGLIGPVRVERDPHGVPHIVASNDHDAFFAIGYVHAQDRMWQLELQRRIAYGRLSEIFGKASVGHDIWFRTLGFARSARAAWSTLSPEAQASLQAYTDGVNQWLASDPVLPPEFAVLGIRPEPWTVYDSLAWVKTFALNLGGNYRLEIERLLAAQIVEPAKMQALFPEHAAGGAKTIAATAPQRRSFERFASFQQELEGALRIGGRYVGSNAWAVSGALTASGTAMLANDPHLGLQIPSLWYMASLKGDRIDAQGATLVGLPLVIFGSNREIAWGGTNLMADAQDLYFEQALPSDSSRYRVGDGSAAFDVRDELIEVRQDFPAFLRNPLRPLRVRIRDSRHGPIVSDMFQVFDQPAALRWTALDADDTSYEAFFQLNHAHDWASFQQALHRLVAPALGVVYADRGGNIGYLAAGRIPVRAAGDGTVPVPGWDDAHAWTGSVPPEQWARAYNPPSGYLVTANNKAVGDDYPHLITRDWAPPSRADRITALLADAVASGAPLDIEAMQRIQADTRNEPARKLLARLLQHRATTPEQQQAYAQLAGWQGDMDVHSRAATIFNAWTRHLKQVLLADDLRGWWNRQRANGYTQSLADAIDLENLQRMLADEQVRWCDDVGTEARAETCDDVLDASLNAALRELQKIEADASMQQWAWGEMHETVYRHMPFSDVNVLRSVFQRRIGSGGSPESINVANYSLEPSGRYVQNFGAGVRQIVALGNGATEHLYMNSTGQSGNVMSRHYDDMIEPFRDVDYLSLSAPADTPRDVLVLVPAAAAARRSAP